jgi:dUTP pyrophosphatase
MKTVKVRIHRVSGGQMPRYQTEGSSGMDIAAAEQATIPAGSFRAVRTGVYLELPKGVEVQVRPRSGLALRHGIGILNSPGTIDSDYRGEILVILFNLGKKPFQIRAGDRIAQLVCSRIVKAKPVEAKSLSRTRRGSGGFGHTG